MPYIDSETRKKLAEDPTPHTRGELTYLIYRSMLDYIQVEGKSYTTMSEAMDGTWARALWGYHPLFESCLRDAQLEFYRRHVAAYEDQKIIENGDVNYEE